MSSQNSTHHISLSLQMYLFLLLLFFSPFVRIITTNMYRSISDIYNKILCTKFHIVLLFLTTHSDLYTIFVKLVDARLN